MSDPPHYIGDDVPPPYSFAGDDANPSPPSSNFVARPSSLPSTSSLFSSHLISLRSQIAAEQVARASAHERNDMVVLSLLVPYIEDLLSSIAGMHPTPTFVEATLVPEGAVETSWQFSDEEESQRPGEVRLLVRVRQDTKSLGEKQGDGFASQTGAMLWWSDESMARRLARLLQPANRPTQESQSRSASRWSMFKREDRPKTSKPSGPAPSPAVRSTIQGPDEGVSMSAKAEEVTFRKENEFGLWETHTGWGIVVRIRIRYVWKP